MPADIDLRSRMTPAPNVKLMINLGACLDIPTGHYIEGQRGESVLNGGLGYITGIVGIGNNFKSTIERFMMLTAMSRMMYSTAKTYDTETSIHEEHQIRVAANIADFHHENILASGRWLVTDKTVYAGDEWYRLHKEELEEKRRRRDITVATPYWNRERSANLSMLVPTFTEIDSFSEFETSNIIEMQDEIELGEAKGNTIDMQQGRVKNRILMEVPRIHTSVYDYLLMTAHIGHVIDLHGGPPGTGGAATMLRYLRNGEKIKGVPAKFTFLTHNCWHAFNAAPLVNHATKGPEYPRSSSDDLAHDTDLNAVLIRNLRGKAGPSGMPITLIVSQSDGVLPSLTEFHHIRENGHYGLEGSNTSYALALYPEVKLQRTTVRAKIDADPLLRRALTITSEMCQMSYLWHTQPERFRLTPRALYENLKAQGYDWKVLLDTRGWWTHEAGETRELPFLSTLDLIRMSLATGHPERYVPYWLEADRKTIKARYQRCIEAYRARDVPVDMQAGTSVA
ncbi:hypothetical protein [Paraburkholderia adhaesiva]|uniref:hypothetical protein n=1 Tax=Paraburkholderia adhaesiva TaxID=2883244 RepID=UPI001F347175|nr:hypothetical protein [Paraburkholderia adhaesiva]